MHKILLTSLLIGFGTLAHADKFSFDPGMVLDYDCASANGSGCKTEVVIPGTVTVEFGNTDQALWEQTYKFGGGEFYVAYDVVTNPQRDSFSIFAFVYVTGAPGTRSPQAFFNITTPSPAQLNKVSTMTSERAERNGTFHSGWITVQAAGAPPMTKASLLKERDVANAIQTRAR